ncbi:AMP-binding protein [Plantactinospora sp. KBS50]|uniref:AMP-binding protein n=1 Tax=Plantactinospora sp. KBS50 TaxID=2024580 RepID=UPI000BAAF57B|nr:AMP-binding protein [Plantactinospora sp. KBS50]ASW55636.1 hypothetical protein CIK06_17800 [Plantactinospora sp. KBS50]
MTDAPIALPTLVAQRAAECPERVFVIDAVADREVTYGEIHERARRWAAALAALGVRPGDPVATMLLNEPESVAIWLGIGYLGAVEVPGNVDYRGSLLRHYLTTSRAAVAVVHASCAARITELTGPGGALRTVVVGPAGAADPLPELRTPAPTDPVPPNRLSGTASVMFTSGTTGPSKG